MPSAGKRATGAKRAAKRGKHVNVSLLTQRETRENIKSTILKLVSNMF